jgi:hypothetical protein
MKLEFTKDELITILHGLNSAADKALTFEEARTYDALAERIEELMVTSTRCNNIE